MKYPPVRRREFVARPGAAVEHRTAALPRAAPAGSKPLAAPLNRRTTKSPKTSSTYQLIAPPPDLAVTVTATSVAASTAVALPDPPAPVQVSVYE